MQTNGGGGSCFPPLPSGLACAFPRLITSPCRFLCKPRLLSETSCGSSREVRMRPGPPRSQLPLPAVGRALWQVPHHLPDIRGSGRWWIEVQPPTEVICLVMRPFISCLPFSGSLFSPLQISGSYLQINYRQSTLLSPGKRRFPPSLFFFFFWQQLYYDITCHISFRISSSPQKETPSPLNPILSCPPLAAANLLSMNLSPLDISYR